MSSDDVFDYDSLAEFLGVPRSTLPQQATTVGEATGTKRAACDLPKPLSDQEWEIIQPHIPLPPISKPGVDYDDRRFVGAAFFYAAVKQRGLGWAHLPTDVYGCRSSREKRWARWVMAETWDRLAEALKDEERLSTSRRIALARIANDAKARRERILAARERLTNAC